MRIPNLDSLTTKQVCLIGSLLSLIASILIILQSDVLSYDSLLYLETARTYLNSGLEAAVAVYPWPFLSVIIATLHQVTGLSLPVSGHLLITLLYAAITCCFILLVSNLGGNTRTQLIAAILILIFPTFNDYRDYIIRDPGYWFCVLLSLHQLLRFARQRSFNAALGWVLSIALAVTFRTEALFIAAFAPLALLLPQGSPMRERLQRTGLIYCLLLVVSTVVLAGLLTITSVSADKFRLFLEVVNLPQFFGQISDKLATTIDQLSATQPNIYTADDMEAIYLSGLMGLLIITMLHALTTPYLALYIWQRRSYWVTLCSSQTTLIAAYLVCITAYLCLFIYKEQFVTDRFFLLFVLIFMLPLSFTIESLLFRQPADPFAWRKILVGALLLYQLLDSSVSTGTSKAYIASAAQWINDNNPAGAQVISDQEHIGYFAGKSLGKSFKFNALEMVESQRLEAGDIVALRIRHRQKDRMARVNKLQHDGILRPLKTFANQQQDQLVIFTFNPKVAN